MFFVHQQGFNTIYSLKCHMIFIFIITCTLKVTWILAFLEQYDLLLSSNAIYIVTAIYISVLYMRYWINCFFFLLFVIGTNLGAFLVNVESGVSSQVLRCKSDVLSLQLDNSVIVIHLLFFLKLVVNYALITWPLYGVFSPPKGNLYIELKLFLKNAM